MTLRAYRTPRRLLLSGREGRYGFDKDSNCCQGDEATPHGRPREMRSSRCGVKSELDTPRFLLRCRENPGQEKIVHDPGSSRSGRTILNLADTAVRYGRRRTSFISGCSSMIRIRMLDATCCRQLRLRKNAGNVTPGPDIELIRSHRTRSGLYVPISSAIAMDSPHR